MWMVSKRPRPVAVLFFLSYKHLSTYNTRFPLPIIVTCHFSRAQVVRIHDCVPLFSIFFRVLWWKGWGGEERTRTRYIIWIRYSPEHHLDRSASHARGFIRGLYNIRIYNWDSCGSRERGLYDRVSCAKIGSWKRRKKYRPVSPLSPSYARS